MPRRNIELDSESINEVLFDFDFQKALNKLLPLLLALVS